MILDFEKQNGLIPAIIQDAATQKVLMLGYMNEEALAKTQQEGRVTFFSRTKNRLWTKGETSGNYLTVKNIMQDCDNDTLLITVIPDGPVCHTGAQTCFGDVDAKGFLYQLEQTVAQRADDDVAESYTNSLLKRGINKVAQKVGEEAVELVIEAKDDNADLFKNEAADLLFHFMVLLRAKGFTLEEIEGVLRDRAK
ncbi:bifunctional phosphoribosyl-AMP cyclohydrolase/phosphoribosyl-ATP diphosphatase HisIE [Flavobacterium sp. RHBU_24]|uniref:bifunctional phosphoribosyl-AMP cyclohydrolase/phosphoribosyl-ATP diphosphatase HisIE n=1 Tax=Flavobacterium sp. RHBU_24 TaxID=3391185 RepID=UPI0039854F5A